MKREFNKFLDYQNNKTFIDVLLKIKPDVKNGLDIHSKEILEHKYRLLKKDPFIYYSMNDESKWEIDPVSQRRWRLFRNRLFLFGIKGEGDIKYIWELNRHQYLITIGKAYVYTKDEKYAKEIITQILDWVGNTHRGKSVNWISPLEMSVRLISWIWALSMISDSKSYSKESIETIKSSIYLQTVYISNNLQKREFPNNHLIGEASALFIVGILYPQFKESEQWKQLGLKILEEQINIQISKDGTDKEQAIDYHRFVLDYYTIIMILGQKYGIKMSDNFEKKLERMYEVLLYTIRPDGLGPMIGDDDNGRAAKLSEEYGRNYLTALSTGATLFNKEDMKWISQDYHEESLWLLGVEGYEGYNKLGAKPPLFTSYEFKDAGQYVMRSGWEKEDLYLYFDCGPQGMGEAGHGHADALSFELFAYGSPLVIDSGTYTYNGPQKWRNYFRGTSAHNTIFIDNVDQAEPLTPYDPFGWKKKADGYNLDWQTSRYFDYVSGYHDGYMRLKDPVKHQRTILFIKSEYWIVTDYLEASKAHKYKILYHLSPGKVLLDEAANSFRTVNEGEANIIISIAPEHNSSIHTRINIREGELNPIQGWVSYNYGDKLKAPVFEYTVNAEGPIIINSILYPCKSAADLNLKLESINVVTERIQKEPEQTKCLEISFKSIKDYYLFSLNREKKTFNRFSTDAEVLYIRTNKKDEIIKIYLKNGSFVKLNGTILVQAIKGDHVIEIDIVRNEANIISSDFMQLKLNIKNVDLVRINNKLAEMVKNGGEIIINGKL